MMVLIGNFFNEMDQRGFPQKQTPEGENRAGAGNPDVLETKDQVFLQHHNRALTMKLTNKETISFANYLTRH